MTMSVANSVSTDWRSRGLAPLCVGAATYLLLLFAGDNLLHDPDTLWQIRVGQWILDHRALPYTDTYSFTKPIGKILLADQLTCYPCRRSILSPM
jgi:hypothetical protein